MPLFWVKYFWFFRPFLLWYGFLSLPHLAFWVSSEQLVGNNLPRCTPLVWGSVLHLNPVGFSAFLHLLTINKYRHCLLALPQEGVGGPLIFQWPWEPSPPLPWDIVPDSQTKIPRRWNKRGSQVQQLGHRHVWHLSLGSLVSQDLECSVWWTCLELFKGWHHNVPDLASRI